MPQKITFNENGEAVNEQGAVIGKKDGSGRLVMIPQSEEPKKEKIIANNEKTSTPQVKGKTVSYSKYEVRPESEFKIEFCLGEKDGRIVVYTKEAFLQLPDLECHWVVFRMWKYEEELDWKNKCQEYDPQSRSFKTNTNKLDELKVRHLIKSWSFEEYDPKFKLLHANRYLSDESYDIFKGFYPTIINNIIFLMNQVLEHNG